MPVIATAKFDAQQAEGDLFFRCGAAVARAPLPIASAFALSDTTGQTNFDLCTSPESKRLHDAMLESYTALQSAHENYERALAIAQDTDQLTREGIVALQRRRLDYAEAVAQYHTAAMAWLSHANTTQQKTIKLVRKTTTGE